jgi:RHS repeat-associated protein
MYNYSAQCVAFVYKYTGKERDPESGLDYFGARHHASALGRFMEPDAVFADQHPGSPQSWNLYTYAANNPLRNRDITGRGVIDWVALGQAVANWFSSGIARDGGVGNFAQNNAIGAAKGAGTFGVNTVKTAAAAFVATQVSIPAAVSVLTSPNPGVLQPSNTTQAQASTATQVGLTLTSAVAGAAVGGAGEGASALTAEEIETGLANAELRTTQDSISGPVVNRFIDMLRSGISKPTTQRKAIQRN